MTKVLDITYDIIKKICIVVFALTVVLGIIQVLSRYVVGLSIPFSEEINRFMFVWVVMLGSSLVMRDKTHAAITILIHYMPKGLAKVFKIGVYLISIGFLVLLFYYGIKMTSITHVQPAPASKIPMSYAYAAIPMGALFMLVFGLENLVREIFVLPVQKPGKDINEGGGE